MQILYKASDGKLFDNERECDKYEVNKIIEIINDSNIKIFDRDLYPLTFKELMKRSSLDELRYNISKMIIPTDEDYEKLSLIYDYYKYNNPFPSKGTYYSVIDNLSDRFKIFTEEEYIIILHDMEKLMEV